LAEAKLSFCDWLAVTVAGAPEQEIQSLIEVIRLMGGNPQATVIGQGMKTSALYATLVNGMSSHVLDFDDTSRELHGHTSVTIFPCLLALSEWKRLGGRDFLTAYVAGFETGCRVGLGASDNHYLKGWHATSTIGHFSSTAAAARLLGLSAERLVHAFGTAGTQAAGLQKVFGTSCKPFHAGKAGFDGLLSALLAERGFTSIDNILEGEKCFWDMYSSGWDAQKAEEGLGTVWYLPDNIFKFHASCLFTHATIYAVQDLKAQHKIDSDRVERIEVGVTSQVIEIAGKKKPATALEGKFSVPYTVANALMRDDTGMAAFTDEKVNDARVTALRDKVVMVADETITSFESDVRITAGGETYRRRVSLDDRKMPFEEKKKAIQQKFRSLAAPILGKDRVEELISRIDKLEEENNMAELAGLLA
jgi:2-methylcitrate dehydratase PrpD